MRNRHRKDWEKLTNAEREAVFEDMDRLGPRLDHLARPMTRAERAKLNAVPTKAQYEAKRGRGRPKLGGVGAKNVLVSIEPSLLKRANAYAKKNRLSRSALFCRGVQMAMSV
jgi:hypothetical protein